ncbi:MAG: septation protein A [Zoogloeaceae bacterium]|nr:septation protein A [Zoogloeaceae bacterium]
MKFFPVILFFITFKLMGYFPALASDWANRWFGATSPDQAPILIATLVVIPATLFQIVWVFWRHGKVEKMLWVSLVLVTTFGALTLIFHDATFIKWKPTVLYWVMAFSMGIALFFKKNAMRLILQNQLDLPEAVWFRLNLSWIGFFLVLGVLNLYVAYTFSTETWVDFKLFGVMGFMFLFAIAQGLYLSRFMKEEEDGAP